MGTESGRAIQGCWAGSLGDCGGGISREHYVSECLFPNQSIFVQGLDWCLDKPKELRIESLTAKILCKDDNAALSELDAAAGLAFSSMRDCDCDCVAYGSGNPLDLHPLFKSTHLSRGRPLS